MKLLYKILALLCCVVLCGFCFAGCTTTPTPESPVSAEEMINVILTNSSENCNSTYCYGEKNYETYFEYWYDMPMSFVSDGAISTDASAETLDEVSILYPVSEITYSTVKSALEKRLESQKEMDSDIKGGIVESGGYLLLVIGEDYQTVVTQFMEQTKGLTSEP